MIYQFFIIIVIVGIFFAVYYFVRARPAKQPSKSGNMEQKLDRIIELLEKDKKE
ncbi:hypothetical protein CVN76_19440 [Bacillus sp. mrc49]|nr:hypothetical protein CVN76_19440 [Bacillus sp. mrc49]